MLTNSLSERRTSGRAPVTRSLSGGVDDVGGSSPLC